MDCSLRKEPGKFTIITFTVNLQKILNSIFIIFLEEIVQAFKDEFGEKTPVKEIDPAKLKIFLKDNFNPPNDELNKCDPKDWHDKPEKIIKIQDKTLREWALNLHATWRTLCREIKPEVKANASRHSILDVDHPFIVPGGRFREFYYWDSYWVIKGLLISGMHESAKNIIMNMAQIVER